LGRCIAGYPDVLPLNIVSSKSFTRQDLPAPLATHFVGVDDHMEGALSCVQTSMYWVGAPRGLLTVTTTLQKKHLSLFEIPIKKTTFNVVFFNRNSTIF
jgi:hypothetical protein